jgi:hypothetical protein
MIVCLVDPTSQAPPWPPQTTLVTASQVMVAIRASSARLTSTHLEAPRLPVRAALSTVQAKLELLQLLTVVSLFSRHND